MRTRSLVVNRALAVSFLSLIFVSSSVGGKGERKDTAFV